MYSNKKSDNQNNSFCSRLQCSDFGFTADDPAVFARPQWCRTSRYGFLLYRVLIACYLVFVEVFTIFKLSGTFGFELFIYFTEWMSLAFIAYSILTVFAAIRNKPGTPNYSRFEDTGNLLDRAEQKSSEPTPIAFKIAWFLYNVCLSTCPFVTIIYWSFVQDAGWYDTTSTATYYLSYAIDIHTHALITIMVYVDLFVASTPIRMAHMIYGVIFALIYIMFTAIYWFAGGMTPEAHNAIYHIIDWEYPVQTMYYIMVALVILCMFHTMGYFLYKLKVYCFGCISAKSRDGRRGNSRACVELEEAGQAPLAQGESSDC